MMEATVKICPSCGARQSGTDACSVCGFEFGSVESETPVSQAAPVLAATPRGAGFCPSCGTAITPGARFCASCGSALTPGATPPAAAVQALPAKTLFTAAGVIVVIVAGIAILTSVLKDKPPATTPAQPAQQAQQQPQQPRSLSEEQINAISHFKKAVADNPNDTLSLLHLANTLYDVENYKEALPYYAQYMNVNAKNADVTVDFAYCKFRTGDSEGAIDALQSAIKFTPDHQKAHYVLAIVYLTTGQMAEGAAWLTKCIAIDSTSQVGQEAKNLLSNHAQWMHK